jgi:hypothetical protein
MVMAPIVWGWWQSKAVISAGGYGDWVVINFESRISFGRVRTGRSGWYLPTGWTSIPVLEASRRMQLPPPRLLRHEGGVFLSDTDPARVSGMDNDLLSMGWDQIYLLRGRKGDWLCQVPHWLLLAGVALPWAGALVWLRRRGREELRAEA